MSSLKLSLKKNEEKPDRIERVILSLTQALLSDLKEEIPHHLQKLIDIRFKGLKDALEPISGIESKLRDFENNMENLQISYKNLNDQFDSLRRKSQNLPQTVKETIENSMEKGQEEIVNTINEQLEEMPTKPAKQNTKQRKRRLLFFKK